MDSELTQSRMGAWIVNISKHLLQYAPNSLGLTHLGRIFFAGKCGSLLIKLSADETEQLTAKKVGVHAQLSGIDEAVLAVYLDKLGALGCLGRDRLDRNFEVLSFSRQRVLETTWQIFETSDFDPLEINLLYILEFCLFRPRLESELKEYLSRDITEQDIDHILGLIEQFRLLGSIIIPERSEKLYFNEYQFGNRAIDIGKAISALSEARLDEVDHLLNIVASRPGTPLEDIEVSDKATALAIGLGLVEVSEVSSRAGTARFLTMPVFASPSVGRETEHLEDDIFHHAKMFLSSLRFGELKSSPSRGKIIDPVILVSSLLNQGEIGPCTAIGEDYVILESEGIIRTVRATSKPGNQFRMQIRRREPVEMVLNILESGSMIATDVRSIQSLEWPVQYAGPEAPRAIAAKRVVEHDPETVRRFCEVIRS